MMMIQALTSPRCSRFCFALFLLCAGLSSGCGGKEEAPQPQGEEIAYGVMNYPEVANKLASCNLVVAGKLGDAGPFGEAHCKLQCLLQLNDCDTVAEVYCSTTRATASERQVYEACVPACLQDLGMFTCNDTTTILGEQECDGHSDCSAGEDEQGCGTTSFLCDGTKVYSVTSICDGKRECADGTDEPAGCVVSQCAL
ncbi:MAG TPA: LDL receptor domain-containing protein [Polyangiaceae bacterium]|nr:LDL receptor domain-containing protein [Polyangiaceae bacterium]